MADGGTRSMLAVWVNRETPGRLALRETAAPTPGPSDVLIAVKAFSLNRGEVRTALNDAPDGWRPGWDVAGVVEQAAADGSGPPQGARVVAATMGGWAELAAVPAERTAEIPDAVGFAAAASLPVAGLTARAALRRGGVLKDRMVLVGGASGGVGTFALQLARLAGARVTAAIRDPGQAEMARRLGADQVAVGPELVAAAAHGPFDLILESVGGPSLAQALGLLRPGGTCVLLGASAGAETTFDASRFRVGGATLYGLVMGYEFQIEPPRVGLAELAALVAAGALWPEIAVEASWTEVARVGRELMDRRFTGKAVLHVQ
jgi:NADPH2:quinone reductase